METIEEYLNEYLKILTQDESTTRDSETWYEYNIDEEIENIKEWSRRRIEFLDRYFYNF